MLNQLLLKLVCFVVIVSAQLPAQNGPPFGQNDNSRPDMQNQTSIYFGEPYRPYESMLLPSLVVMAVWIAVNLIVSGVAFKRHRVIVRDFKEVEFQTEYFTAEEDSDEIELIGSEFSVMERDTITLGCAFVDYQVKREGVSFVEKFKGIFSSGDDVKILSTISAQFRPGTLTAIMGPSGSGKTTLLNLLSGRTKKGEMEGYRLINHFPTPHKEFNEIMKKDGGYVLQTDTFFKDLTVRETMMYAALLRLPGESIENKAYRVNQVIKEVGLEKVSDTKVGDEFTTGLSGGQKRRLSIALELINIPSIILLDEPTSGLDASTAHKLILLLKELADKYHRTIVTTIHSPRPESFAIFDDILLLGQDGQVVFFGAADDAVEYFKKSGFDAGDDISPGDYIIDIVGLDPEESMMKNSSQLSRIYKESSHRVELTDKIINNLTDEQVLPSPLPMLGFWEETCILFSRRISRSSFSDYSSLFLQIALIGILLAVAFGGKGYDSLNIWYRPYKSVMFIVTLVSYAMIVQYLNLVPQYFNERNIFRRELENGSCRISSYFLSCMLYETPICFMQVTLMTWIGYWLVDLNTDLRIIFFFVFFLTIGVSAWQAIVCLCSFLTNDIGTVYNIVFFLLGAGTLFGGLPIVYSNIPEYFLPFYYSSIPAITYRALLHSELICCNMTFDCDDLAALAVQYVNSSNIPPPMRDAQQACESGLSDQVVNLGALALNFLDIEKEIEYADLVVLFLVIITIRFLAVWTYKFKLWREYRLKDITSTSIHQKAKFE